MKVLVYILDKLALAFILVIVLHMAGVITIPDHDILNTLTNKITG